MLGVFCSINFLGITCVKLIILKKMKINGTYLLVILIAIVFGCNTSEQQNEEEIHVDPKSEGEVRDELYQEVIEVHDIAMVKMQSIMNLKGKAIKKADSLRSLEDESLASHIQVLEEIQITLEGANKSMMIWMREFRPPSDTLSHSRAMKYLRAEQDKIVEVNDFMDKAINEAEAL